MLSVVVIGNELLRNVTVSYFLQTNHEYFVTTTQQHIKTERERERVVNFQDPDSSEVGFLRVPHTKKGTKAAVAREVFRTSVDRRKVKQIKYAPDPLWMNIYD